jgi:hypothetical protein
MSDALTYRALREAIASIKEVWPDAASWREVLELESVLPKESPQWAGQLPEDAREPVRKLLEKIRSGRVGVVPRPMGKCDELARWVGFDLNA